MINSAKSFKSIFPAKWHLFLLLWGFTPFSIFAGESDNIYQVIRKSFPIASPLMIILIGSCIILALALVVAWEIFKSDKQKRDKLDLSWKNFSEFSRARNLNPDENELLKEILNHSELAQVDIIFQSPNIYEESLSTYIQKKIDAGTESTIPYDSLYNLRQKMGYSRIPNETHLSSSRQLNAGMWVSIKNIRGEYHKCFVKSVDEKNWTLSTKQGGFGEYKTDGPIHIWLIRNGDAEYRIETTVQSGQSNLLVLEHSMKLHRKQLRNWVRVDVNLPCKAVVLNIPETADENEKPAIKRGVQLEGRITDISGGGICLRVKAPLEAGSQLSLNFDLPGSSLRGLLTEVLSSTPPLNAEDTAVCRLKFKNIETAVQEKIVRFVFEKSRIDSQFR